MRGARGCVAITLVSCVRSDPQPDLTSRRAVHAMNTITVGRGRCMLVVLAQVCSSELFIDRARVSRMRSCVVRGVRQAAQMAGGRIIGRRREMRRHRRDPREKELQDQRACHLAHARPGICIDEIRRPPSLSTCVTVLLCNVFATGAYDGLLKIWGN